jgi:hypothetical protein
MISDLNRMERGNVGLHSSPKKKLNLDVGRSGGDLRNGLDLGLGRMGGYTYIPNRLPFDTASLFLIR